MLWTIHHVTTAHAAEKSIEVGVGIPQFSITIGSRPILVITIEKRDIARFSMFVAHNIKKRVRILVGGEELGSKSLLTPMSDGIIYIGSDRFEDYDYGRAYNWTKAYVRGENHSIVLENIDKSR
jgi:hypothetical protein